MIMMCAVKLSAQSYSYSYTDPCTGNVKTLSVPINGSVSVSYYGQIQNFSYTQITNGALETWANDIFSQFGGNNPCASIIGMPTAINITQGSVYNTIGIINSLTSVADLASSISGTTNVLGGSVGSIGNSSGDNGGNGSSKDSKNGSSNNNSSTSSQGSTTQGTNPSGGSSSGSGSTSNNTQNGNSNNGNSSGSSSGNGSPSGGSNGSGSSSESTQGGSSSSTSSTSGGTSSQGGNGGSSSSGSSGTQGSSGSSNSGTGTGSSTTQTEEGKGSTNITAGGTNTVKADNNGGSSSGSKSPGNSKEGGKPQIVASSDFVGFNFKNSEVSTGLKATGGYTALRWDGARASGVLADYTSAQKGPNITGYYAYIKPKTTTLISGTLTLGFEGLGSQYGTLAIGQMRSFKSTKHPGINKLKVVYMATGSFGRVYKEAFIGTAAIAGGMYDLKIGKRLDIKLMGLFVYAPYVSYYNDIVMKSPYVVLPSIGTNIGITKRFKFNINAGGAWAINEKALNYTVTMGTRLML